MEEIEKSSETAEARHESGAELTQCEEMHKTRPSDVPFFVSFCLSRSKSGVNSAHFNDNRYRFTHLNATRIRRLVISGQTNYMATENICRQLFCLFKSNTNVHFITRRDACCFHGRRRCAESGKAFF